MLPFNSKLSAWKISRKNLWFVAIVRNSHYDYLNSPKLAVIASMSLGFRLRGRPFWRGACGNPVILCAAVP